MRACVCVFRGGGVGLLPNKCYWCMDVLLIKVTKSVCGYSQTNQQHQNLQKKTKNIKPYFKTALQIFCLGTYM